MPEFTIKAKPALLAEVAGIPQSAMPRVTTAVGPQGPAPPPPPPPPPVANITSVTVQDLGAGEWSIGINFDQQVARFATLDSPPAWTFEDANGPVVGIDPGWTFGDTVWIASFSGSLTPPLSVTVPPGATQGVGQNGGFIAPGTFSSE